MSSRTLWIFVLTLFAATLHAQPFTWQSVAGFTAGPRQGAIMFAIGDTIYVVGGQAGNLTIYKDMNVYALKTQKWSTIPAGAGIGRAMKRAYGVGCVIGGKAYFGMGRSADALDSTVMDWWEFDPATHTFARKHDYPGQRYDCYAFALGGQVFVGGGIDNLGRPSSDLSQYDPHLDSWQTVPTPPFGPRARAATFTIGDSAFVACGSAGFETYHSAWCYDGTVWKQVADFPASARDATTGWTLNGKGYVGFGESTNTTFYSEIYRYDPKLDQWTLVPPLPGNPRRAWASAAVAGNVAVVGLGGNLSTNQAFGDLYSVTQGAPNGAVTSEATGAVAIYPNPATNFVELPNDEPARVRVMNALGILVLMRQVTPHERLDLSRLSAGVYHIEVSTSRLRVAQLIVRE